jgi:hypothetical protein
MPIYEISFTELIALLIACGPITLLIMASDLVLAHATFCCNFETGKITSKFNFQTQSMIW